MLLREIDLMRACNSGLRLRKETFLIKDLDIDIKYFADIENCVFFMFNSSIFVNSGFGNLNNNMILDLENITTIDVETYTKGANILLSDFEYLKSLAKG